MRMLGLLRHHAMTITPNARLLVPTRLAPTARVLALQHLVVLHDAMPLVHRHMTVFFARNVLLARRPGEVISAHLDVVVCKLAELVVVQTQQLGLLASAEVQSGDVVDDVGDDGGHDKGVGGRGDNVGDLDVHLAVIVVDPPARQNAGIDAVEADDVVCAKQCIKEETHHSRNAVLSKDVEGVVDVDEIFDCEKRGVSGLGKTFALAQDSLLVA